MARKDSGPLVFGLITAIGFYNIGSSGWLGLTIGALSYYLVNDLGGMCHSIRRYFNEKTKKEKEL
jgi:hypothetical protein